MSSRPTVELQRRHRALLAAVADYVAVARLQAQNAPKAYFRETRGGFLSTLKLLQQIEEILARRDDLEAGPLGGV